MLIRRILVGLPLIDGLGVKHALIERAIRVHKDGDSLKTYLEDNIVAVQDDLGLESIDCVSRRRSSGGGGRHALDVR